MVELQVATKIKSIQIDWGDEFQSLTSFLANHSILHILICPDTRH